MTLSTMRMAVVDSFLADSHRRANRGRRLDLHQWSGAPISSSPLATSILLCIGQMVPQAARVWANDMENIPVFFALCGLAIDLETAAGPNVWLSIVFTAAKLLYTWAYLARVQPLRTVLYGIGVICLLGFCVVVTARVVSFFAL
ncbi:MAPEG family protein [Pseudomonas pudica]|uniref:Microsomal glutathione S-transferase 1 n=2 Tax=Pseudomonas pudica TaxID=272772 RepID=A0ABS0FZI9_9PSED|nr:MAPEG family protein [Pseudomonas pudica]MBF8759430.1 MAPEG family protein [Pseudomonas pudica]